METFSPPPQTLKARRNLYYTNDYEWIEFQGSVAYIGLCASKLAGIKEIDTIEFSRENNTKKSGEIIASIIYEDYKIDVHMPVSGCIVFYNAAILAGDKNIVLHEPETKGYIALIFPSFPYDRSGLVTS